MINELNIFKPTIIVTCLDQYSFLSLVGLQSDSSLNKGKKKKSRLSQNVTLPQEWRFTFVTVPLSLQSYM